jgi:hypothetical protein
MSDLPYVLGERPNELFGVGARTAVVCRDTDVLRRFDETAATGGTGAEDEEGHG